MRTSLLLISILLLHSCTTINLQKELNNGIRLYKADSTNEAVNVLSKVISSNDTCYDAHLYRGWAYKDLKEYENAYNDFGKLIYLKKDSEVGYANRASIYYLKSDYLNALKDYQKALAINPKATILYNPISHMLFITGKKDEACKYYQMSQALGDSTFNEEIIEYCRDKNFR